MVAFLEHLGLEAAKQILSKTIEAISKRLESELYEIYPFEQHRQNHYKETLKWASRLQFYGMPQANDLASSTVPLGLSSELRQFGTSENPIEFSSEDELISSPEHFVLLGEPGSGKTTTIKRLVLKIILQPPNSVGRFYRYPVVLRFRELRRGEHLETKLADIFGIPYKTVDKKIRGGTFRTHIHNDRKSLLNELADFLNSRNVLLLLDGMDELPRSMRESIQREIVSLGYKLHESKIIVTTRSGDHNKLFGGFDMVEILPLNEEQQKTISAKWLDDVDGFFNAISRVPYADAINRPLLLTQLLVLYKRKGALPDQPCHTYGRLVQLFLEDWDDKRGVSRESKYSGFGSERKSAFLAALSHEITYKHKNTRFTEKDLVSIYSEIYKLFYLPAEEAIQVAREIQTHTGLVQIAGENNFEFSHFSLQEYLCAKYIVGSPFPESIDRYLTEHSGPLAIAVSLASDPGVWFAGLFLRPENLNSWKSDKLFTFLSRLKIERPGFRPSYELGIAILTLWNNFNDHQKLIKLLHEMMENSAIMESVKIIFNIPFYIFDPQYSVNNTFLGLRARSSYYNRAGFRTPKYAAIPANIFKNIIQDKNCMGQWIDKNEMIGSIAIGTNGENLCFKGQEPTSVTPETISIS